MKVLWLAVSILLLSFTAARSEIKCEGVAMEIAIASMLKSSEGTPFVVKPVEIMEGSKFEEFLIIFNDIPPKTEFKGDSVVVFEIDGFPSYCIMIFKKDQCVVRGCILRGNLDHLLSRNNDKGI